MVKRTTDEVINRAGEDRVEKARKPTKRLVVAFCIKPQKIPNQMAQKQQNQEQKSDQNEYIKAMEDEVAAILRSIPG